MLSIRFVLLLASAAAVTTALALQSPPPGLKLTLSEDCITYGKDWAINKLLPSLQNLHAPDVHGSSGSPIGNIDYDLTSIVLHTIALSRSSVTLQPSGMQISVDLDISATLNWHYKCWVASDGGTADLKLSGASVSFLLSFGISTVPPFYPVLETHNVDAAVADISFTLHGGASWLYNLFVSSFKDSIKNSIVSSLRDAINPDDINKDLARISEDRQLTSYAAFNFDILQPPTLTTTGITFDVLGQILPNVSSAPYPLTPSPLPDTIRGSMVEIIFDQTLLRSASSTVYSAGLLAHSVTPLDFPKLNTSNFCFFSPSLCQQYPDEGIVLSIAAADAPLIDVNVTGISTFLNVSVHFSANSSSGALSSFLNISCAFSLAASLALGNNASGAVIVTAEFTMPSPVDIEVVGSSIGPLDTTLLTQVINEVAKTIVLPWLNYKGQHQGFAIPVPHGLQLNNSSVAVGESYVAIISDVHLE